MESLVDDNMASLSILKSHMLQIHKFPFWSWEADALNTVQ